MAWVANAVEVRAAYGCDVTAFTSSESKFDDAPGSGAHHVVSSRGSAAIGKLRGRLDLLISTVNVPLDWDAMINTLAPNGRLPSSAPSRSRFPSRRFP